MVGDEDEIPLIRKDKTSIILNSEKYIKQGTNLMIFHFEPKLYNSTQERIRKAIIQNLPFDDRILTSLSSFFSPAEKQAMREFNRNARFSLPTYNTNESIKMGEKPTYGFTGSEAWEFFKHSPQPIKEIYKLLGTLAYLMDADVSTFPWWLQDPEIGHPTINVNRVTEMTPENSKLGKHADSLPEKAMFFGIPVLYANNGQYHTTFNNGDVGKPLIMSCLLYVTEFNFISSEYGLGTLYYSKNGEIAHSIPCQHMDLHFFQSDIIHTIEDSRIPPDVNTYRTSYVFKLIFNPRHENQPLKELFWSAFSK